MKSFLSALHCFAFFTATLIFNAGAFAQPTVESPLLTPTGSYSVGRTEFDWTDTARSDPQSPSGHREIVVWVWYPASPKSGAQPAEWMPGKWGELFWENFAEHYSDAAEMEKKYPIHSILSHSYEDAPVASGNKKYPVLLFAPGLSLTPLEYTSLIEDVVSHGYIVAGIVPTYSAKFTVFSDGRVANQTPFKPGPDAYDQGVNIWTADLQFTLNQLEKLNADAKSPFKNRFNFKEVGTFGHSMGGGAALQFAKNDPRVKAIFDLDGMQTDDVIKEGLPKPVLVLSGDHPGVVTPLPPGRRMNPLMNYSTLLRGAKPGYYLMLAGSTHSYSCDDGVMPFLSPSARNNKQLLGSIDSARALSVTATYVDAFFGEYLEGKKSTLLSGPSTEYPEIIFVGISATVAAQRPVEPNQPDRTTAGDSGTTPSANSGVRAGAGAIHLSPDALKTFTGKYQTPSSPDAPAGAPGRIIVITANADGLVLTMGEGDSHPLLPISANGEFASQENPDVHIIFHMNSSSQVTGFNVTNYPSLQQATKLP